MNITQTSYRIQYYINAGNPRAACRYVRRLLKLCKAHATVNALNRSLAKVTRLSNRNRKALRVQKIN